MSDLGKIIATAFSAYIATIAHGRFRQTVSQGRQVRLTCNAAGSLYTTHTRDDLNTTLGNIESVRAAVGFLDEDDGGRLANGGTGIYRGGAYDAFRRSDNIEDRRKQKYSQNPQRPTKIPFEAARER